MVYSSQWYIQFTCLGENRGVIGLSSLQACMHFLGAHFFCGFLSWKENCSFMLLVFAVAFQKLASDPTNKQTNKTKQNKTKTKQTNQTNKQNKTKQKTKQTQKHT